MLISGLVLILSPDSSERAAVLAALRNEPRIEIGEQVGNRIAVVVEAASAADNDTVVTMLNGLPGVRMVEVAFVGFEGDDPPTDEGPSQTQQVEGTRTLSEKS